MRWSGSANSLGIRHAGSFSPRQWAAVAGTILAQRARGDRVILVWLTRGEMTEAFGPLDRQGVNNICVALAQHMQDCWVVEVQPE